MGRGNGHVGTPVNGHAGLGSTLKSAVQQDAVIVGLFRNGVFLGDLVKVRLVFRVGLLLLVDGWSLHGLAKVRQSSKELLVIIRVAVLAGGDATESPAIGLADKGTELGVLKELKEEQETSRVRKRKRRRSIIGNFSSTHLGNHFNLKLTRLQDPPRASMRQPSHNVLKVLSAQDSVHFGWKVGDTSRRSQGRQWIGISLHGVITVVKVGSRTELPHHGTASNDGTSHFGRSDTRSVIGAAIIAASLLGVTAAHNVGDGSGGSLFIGVEGAHLLAG